MLRKRFRSFPGWYGYGNISRQKGRNDSRESDSPSSTRVARDIEWRRDNSLRISKTNLPPAWYDFSRGRKRLTRRIFNLFRGPVGHCATLHVCTPFSSNWKPTISPPSFSSRSATLCFLSKRQ